jgi:hypothetical protein
LAAAGPDAVETSDVGPVGGLGEMLGNKPELAPRRTGTNRRWRWSPDTDHPVALKRIIAVAQDALTSQAEIARLKFRLARYRRAEFGFRLTSAAAPGTAPRRG